MTSSFQRRAFASSAALLAALLLPVGASAAQDDAPIDAVPLIRPHTPMRGLEPSGEPLATPEPETAPESEPAPAPSVEPRTEAPAAAAPANAPDALPAPEAALLRIGFQPDEATLDAAAVAQLNAFAAAFKTRGGRVGLKSYAGKPGEMSSNARRLSLKRVLAVREALLAQGVSAQRLEVHALGGTRDAGPADRVDIVKSGR